MDTELEKLYEQFPEGFFDRDDPSPDTLFYRQPRIVTHIDTGAIEGVGHLYDELAIEGQVLDLMGSWVSHFRTPPERLIVHGMNVLELKQNTAADGAVVVDLNAHPTLPFPDATFDAVVCTVSVDYLARPLEVFSDLARIVRPGGRAVMNFSNRCFPSKAIQGWLAATDEQRCGIITAYFDLTPAWGAATAVSIATSQRDPLYAVWADRL